MLQEHGKHPFWACPAWKEVHALWLPEVQQEAAHWEGLEQPNNGGQHSFHSYRVALMVVLLACHAKCSWGKCQTNMLCLALW